MGKGKASSVITLLSILEGAAIPLRLLGMAFCCAGFSGFVRGNRFNPKA
tara:strand:+ start:79 stop:225 length:147 start_codon:yes stop_codon:yes gene_type:complete